ncbi:MAG: CBS domain-containing protein, partial [Firmicutes bacterium]|nr:CBS domain-containing protein [Bacillota bacterium]
LDDPVHTAMTTTQLATCRSSDDVNIASKKMAEFQIRRLPVTTDDGRVAGIVAMADLARHHLFTEETGAALYHVSQPSPTPSALQ